MNAVITDQTGTVHPTEEAVMTAVETSAPPLKPCPWCDRTDCPTRWEHERLHRGDESTWRRARLAAAALTPDDELPPRRTA